MHLILWRWTHPSTFEVYWRINLFDLADNNLKTQLARLMLSTSKLEPQEMVGGILYFVLDHYFASNEICGPTIWEVTIAESDLTGIPHTCMSCEEGQYIGDMTVWNALIEQTPCEACTDCSPQQLRTDPAGECSPYAQHSGTCSACEAGHKFVEFADTECVACEAGKYRTDFMSVVSCETCPKFVHASDCDLETCTDVDDWDTRGTSDTGDTACKCKDDNAEMRPVNKQSIQVCKCKPGYYMQDLPLARVL